MMSCRRESRVRKKFAVTRKFEESTGIPAPGALGVNPQLAGFAPQVGLTGCRTKSLGGLPGGAAGHFPGGAVSPCVPGGGPAQIPARHCGTVLPPTVMVAA